MNTNIIEQLQRFLNAINNYAPGKNGAGKELQESLIGLNLPSYVNMKNAKSWCMQEMLKIEEDLKKQEKLHMAEIAVKDARKNQKESEKEVRKLHKIISELQQRLSQKSELV